MEQCASSQMELARGRVASPSIDPNASCRIEIPGREESRSLFKPPRPVSPFSPPRPVSPAVPVRRPKQQLPVLYHAVDPSEAPFIEGSRDLLEQRNVQKRVQIARHAKAVRVKPMDAPCTKSQDVGSERLAMAPQLGSRRLKKPKRKLMREQADLKKLMKLHAGGDCDWMEKAQVEVLLQDLNKGKKLSREEMTYILVLAGIEEEKSDELDAKQVLNIIDVWKAQLKVLTEIELMLNKYDKTKKGELDWDEVEGLLIELNGGRPVSEEEVDWIMDEADLIGHAGSKAMYTQKVLKVLAFWYLRVEAKSKPSAMEIRLQESRQGCCRPCFACIIS